MRKLMLGILLIATMGCAAKVKVVYQPYPVDRPVPTPDCAFILRLKDTSDKCQQPIRCTSVGVDGLGQEILDCRASQDCWANTIQEIAEQVAKCPTPKVDGQ